jgi:hypothetical protein
MFKGEHGKGIIEMYYVGHYIVNDGKDVDEVIFKSCDTFLVKISLYLHLIQAPKKEKV